MPRYFFNLNDRRTTIPDIDGTELADDVTAHAHAVVVAREAMRNNERRTRTWRIQVSSADRSPLFEVLFASVDETMDHLPNELRQSVETVSKKFASLADTIQDVRMSMLEIRTTIARSEKAPYLVVLNGSRLWNGRS